MNITKRIQKKKKKIKTRNRKHFLVGLSDGWLKKMYSAQGVSMGILIINCHVLNMPTKFLFLYLYTTHSEKAFIIVGDI